ncbi:MAG: hypothetical protein AAFQ58_01280 [Pseudomonadota bacterium]
MTDIVISSYGASGRAVLLNRDLLPLAEASFAPFIKGTLRADGWPEVGDDGFALRLELNTGRILRTRARPGDVIYADDIAHEQTTLEEQTDGAVKRQSIQVFETVSVGRVDKVADSARAVVYADNAKAKHDLNFGGTPATYAFDSYVRPDQDLVYVTVLTVIGGQKNQPLTFRLPRMTITCEVTPHDGQLPHIRQKSFDGDILSTMLDILAANAPSVPGLVYDSILSDQISGSYIEDVATQYVRAKFTSPDHAAAGGWYLLKVQKLGRVGDWTRNLADYFPDLPDGAILEAWRRLSGGGNLPFPTWRLQRPPPVTNTRPDPNASAPDDPLVDAAQRLIDATKRGVPVFASGVQRLAGGLDWCARHLPEDQHPKGLMAARARARLWDQALVRGAAFTVLLGAPDKLELDLHEIARLEL